LPDRMTGFLAVAQFRFQRDLLSVGQFVRFKLVQQFRLGNVLDHEPTTDEQPCDRDAGGDNGDDEGFE